MASSVSTASLGSSRTRSGRSATATAAPLGAAPVAASVAVPQSTRVRPGDAPGQQVDVADEAGHERGGGGLVEPARRGHLLDAPAVHHRDAVGHRERLLLVVGHVDRGDPDLALQALELDLHVVAQLLVERAERLVEQQDGGAGDEGSRQRHALLLAARELAGIARAVARKLDEGEGLGHPPGDLRLVHALHAQAEADVLDDGAVREEGVVLEHHPDAPPVRGHPGDAAAVDRHVAGVRRHEAGHRAQRGGLAAPGWPEEREELARGHRQRDPVERQRRRRSA